MNTTKTTTTLARSQYGELCVNATTTEADRALLMGAMGLVQQAAAKMRLPAAFDDIARDRKGRFAGEARHHEIYDILYRNGMVTHVLVCIRETAGSKYGVSTTSKGYAVVAKHGAGTRVLPASKAVAAKAAKAAGKTLGLAVAVCLGKMPAPKPACMRPRAGYKIVRRDGDGFVSVWDGSRWAVGKTRTEAATATHEGGFYYYASLDEALAEAAARLTFGDARQYHDLSILEVEVSGRQFEHESDHGTKLCASRIKPVRELLAII